MFQNKQMTKTTLRYHHKCPGKPVDTNKSPVKRRIKKDEQN